MSLFNPNRRSLPSQWAEDENGDFFIQKMPVPAENVLDDPQICIDVNETWAKYIELAVRRMTYYDAWEGDEAAQQHGTRNAETLAGLFMEGNRSCLDPETPDTDNCTIIKPLHPSVEYWPNHPKLQPNYYETPFNSAPWKLPSIEPFAEPDDVYLNYGAMTTPLQFAGGWHIGLPSIRFHFSGKGEVTPTFLDDVLGGVVWMFPDGNPLLGKMVNLKHIDIYDIFSLDLFFDVIGLFEGYPLQEVTEYITYETGGDHTLTMWWLPVNPEPPFIGWGGGLREIFFCGEIVPSEDVVTAYTLVQDGCSIELRADDVMVSTVQVMTPVPDCDFENEVTIAHPGNNDADMLRLKTTGPAYGQDAGDITWDLLDAAGVPGDAATIRGYYGDDDNRVGSLAFRTLQDGAETQNLRLNTGNISAIVDGYASRAHQVILRVQSADYGWDEARSIIDCLVSARQMLTYRMSGRAVWQRALSIANGVEDFFVMDGFADGVTPANLFGYNLIRARLQSSTTAQRDAMRLQVRWKNATDTARSPEARITMTDYVAEREVIAFGAMGGVSLLGVHGNAPVARPVVVGSNTDETLSSLLEGLALVGYIEDQSSVGTPVQGWTNVLGDRNLPPDAPGDECKASNYMQEFIRDAIAIAYGALILPKTAVNVYLYFTEKHGWVLDQLWGFSLAVIDYVDDASDIIDDIDAHAADIVVAIASNLYDRLGCANALAALDWSYSGSGVLAFWLVRALAEPTWKEYLWFGGIQGTATHSCSGCIGGDPVIGDWAVEWTEPGADWSNGACGTGFSVENNCPPGDATLDFSFTVPAEPALQTYDLSTMSVTVAYNTSAEKFFRVSCSNGGYGAFTFLGPHSFDGIGEHTFVASAGLFENLPAGETIQLHLFSATVMGLDDSVTVTNVRVEGTGTQLPSGQSC